MTIFRSCTQARFGQMLSIALLALLWQPLTALDMRNLDLVSPINGLRFPVVSVPPTQRGGETLADMGADDDGCRHSSGAAEYDYYIATDPRSYFSALIAEWDDRNGTFRGQINNDMKAWVDKEF